MQGIPQLVIQIQLRQQFGDSRRVNTAENVMTCHSPVKSVGCWPCMPSPVVPGDQMWAWTYSRRWGWWAYLSPCANRAQTARRFGILVWVGEIRKSMSGIIRVFHLRIHSETAWRHLYTCHCMAVPAVYKPFIVSRVSLLPKCCLQSLLFPAKPTQMPMRAGYWGLLMKAEQGTTCGIPN